MLEYFYGAVDEWTHQIRLVGATTRFDLTSIKCVGGLGHEAAEGLCGDWGDWRRGAHGWKMLKLAFNGCCESCESCEALKLCYHDHATNYDPEGLVGQRLGVWCHKTINRRLKEAGL